MKKPRVRTKDHAAVVAGVRSGCLTGYSETALRATLKGPQRGTRRGHEHEGPGRRRACQRAARRAAC